MHLNEFITFNISEFVQEILEDPIRFYSSENIDLNLDGGSSLDKQ